MSAITGEIRATIACEAIRIAIEMAHTSGWQDLMGIDSDDQEVDAIARQLLKETEEAYGYASPDEDGGGR